MVNRARIALLLSAIALTTTACDEQMSLCDRATAISDGTEMGDVNALMGGDFERSLMASENKNETVVQYSTKDNKGNPLEAAKHVFDTQTLRLKSKACYQG